jgi:hypothetical protein
MNNETTSSIPVQPFVLGLYVFGIAAMISLFLTTQANAESFRVQCPNSTTLHPTGGSAPGQIKCQEISGSDGYATMGDGHQIYLFGFGPLSGMANILQGLPGTVPATNFNNPADSNSGKFEPAAIMNNGVLAANAPGPVLPDFKQCGNDYAARPV